MNRSRFRNAERLPREKDRMLLLRREMSNVSL